MKGQDEPYKREDEAFKDFACVSSNILQNFDSSNENFWSTYGNNDIDVVIDYEDNR